MKFHYKHTMAACYIGYVTQAIINNLAPLLFVTFQRQFAVSLEQISLLIVLNFSIQIVVDLLATRFVDKIGYRVSIVGAHFFTVCGLIGLSVFPNLFSNAYVGLIVAVVLNSIGGGLIEVLISPMVEALPTDEKAASMSILHSFYCWGQVFVVLLSTLFFVTIGTQHWYYLPPLWAIIPLLNGLFLTKVPIRTLVEEEHRMPLRNLFGRKLFWLLALLMICAGASELPMSQWASLFAETGLHVSKTVGDLLGPCAFAVLMGLSRVFYGKWGAKIDLKKFLIFSSLLCVFSYLLTVFSPHPILSLVGCAICGFSVGILWPGVFSLSSQYLPTGGTAMFALLALAGDVGCASGSSLVGIISEQAPRLIQFMSRFFSGSGDDLKTGLFCVTIFPILMVFGVLLLRKKQGAQLSVRLNQNT